MEGWWTKKAGKGSTLVDKTKTKHRYFILTERYLDWYEKPVRLYYSDLLGPLRRDSEGVEPQAFRVNLLNNLNQSPTSPCPLLSPLSLLAFPYHDSHIQGYPRKGTLPLDQMFVRKHGDNVSLVIGQFGGKEFKMTSEGKDPAGRVDDWCDRITNQMVIYFFLCEFPSRRDRFEAVSRPFSFLP